ncbi:MULTISPECIES: helix-turn-helix domain-containing protein [unclassified Breznakia]|uniref:helix-turn-helix domain-containing protein n=1 Tax=unclassified Breznakia TaxID=2623764 RepID=UPI00247318C6|nr:MULTISPECIES: helix-turn-helix domain-containing protein [unclassified Breznakia]MDH6367155.1 hypothetical protein [Breznakia sp. PH1-1]MDH6404258.1 hypothetical protein [Breznakia sp. PF1-11]MDH6412043.1 hypothetical protein [Breznakia sp. PFB1-11]MDH6414246.1 hypothetical protein [Breznakia sp. PFB1-14]MDH6416657.1 hypothetical protein [Breznakia sp. PFB1-4]
MEMNKPAYYGVIPATIRYDKKIPTSEKVLFAELTALCNKTGYCWPTDNYLCELYEVGRTTVQRWLNNLEKNGYIKRKLEYKKGSKKVIKRRIYTFEHPMPKNGTPYAQKWDNPMPKNGGDNNTSINTKENNKRKFDYEEAFVIFWDKYPNKKAKPKALTAFRNKCKTTNQFDIILKALDQFIESNDWKKNDGMFIPHPATWLNGERWLDDVAIQKKKPKPKLEDLLPKDFDDLTDEQQRETRMYYQKQIDDGVKNGDYE